MTHSTVNSAGGHAAGKATGLHGQVALITGGARRIGACTTRHLHAAGMRVVIHCRHSRQAADTLAAALNASRPDSARVAQADLDDAASYPALIDQALSGWGRLDALINNASRFYPTPVGEITLADWDALVNSNMKAPLFLAQAAAPALKEQAPDKQGGNIINMVDVHGFRPMRDHPVYCAAKAGLIMLTRALARDLGPAIRVNGIAPGAILWPENGMDEATQNTILQRTALKRPGEPDDIARAIVFLLRDAPYITGQILPVDGGRMLNI